MSSIYQLLVILQDTEPSVWRRIQVPASFNLEQLHQVIQVAMGWTNSHLHAFEIGKTRYSLPDFELDPSDVDERQTTLTSAIPKEKVVFTYDYDFGDSWAHKIKVEQIFTAQPRIKYPRCTAGRSACPPEDCGGPPGYEGLLEALCDLEHPEHADMRRWVGRFFACELLEFKAINRKLLEPF